MVQLRLIHMVDLTESVWGHLPVNTLELPRSLKELKTELVSLLIVLRLRSLIELSKDLLKLQSVLLDLSERSEDQDLLEKTITSLG